MFNSKIKRYEQKQLHPDEKVPRNHWTLWSEADGSRDKPPESMKLFDYRQWKQLTYPSLIDGTDKWETELDNIIKELMVSQQ